MAAWTTEEFLIRLALSFSVAVAAATVVKLLGKVTGKQVMQILLVVTIFSILSFMALKGIAAPATEGAPVSTPSLEKAIIPSELTLELGTPGFAWAIIGEHTFLILLILILIIRTRRVA